MGFPVYMKIKSKQKHHFLQNFLYTTTIYAAFCGIWTDLAYVHVDH